MQLPDLDSNPHLPTTIATKLGWVEVDYYAQQVYKCEIIEGEVEGD